MEEVNQRSPNQTHISKPNREKRKKSFSPSLEQFELTESLREWCVNNDISQTVAQAELPKFLDWHRAKGRWPKDTAAAFRNWLRKSKEFQPRIAGGFVG
ncbi:MAG: hypothetical protein HY695_07860 [Deltaproteobacteria bacterium]|nr:hypothetical protein [Deltaproteobacteria bacterium]